MDDFTYRHSAKVCGEVGVFGQPLGRADGRGIYALHCVCVGRRGWTDVDHVGRALNLARTPSV